MAIRILRLYEVPDLHAREGIRGLRVLLYEVDGHGPFSLELRREEWSVAEMHRRLSDEAARIRAALQGI